MVSRGASRFKRESTVTNGLITPDESMTSFGTVHPKEEELDPVSLSDKLQGGSFNFHHDPPVNFHHGLPVEADSLNSEAAERQRRSASGKS
jgi:hypothetical protein